MKNRPIFIPQQCLHLLKFIVFFKIPDKETYTFFESFRRPSLITTLVFITFVLIILILVVVMLVLAFTVVRTATQVRAQKPSSSTLASIGRTSFLRAPTLDKLYDSLGSRWKSCHYRDPLCVLHCPSIIAR